MRKNSSLELWPGPEDSERPVTSAEIQQMGARSSSSYFKQACEQFLLKIEAGDELVEFCTSRVSWDNNMGRAGFLLRRDGVMIAELVCRMN